MLRDNPDLSIDNMSRPIVTNALTHGLSLVGDLFVNQGDTILLPEHNWELQTCFQYEKWCKPSNISYL